MSITDALKQEILRLAEKQAKGLDSSSHTTRRRLRSARTIISRRNSMIYRGLASRSLRGSGS
ncbi:MAG: hypothetical protein ABFC77_14860 [Thermoguttaceae bacterium]